MAEVKTEEGKNKDNSKRKGMDQGKCKDKGKDGIKDRRVTCRLTDECRNKFASFKQLHIFQSFCLSGAVSVFVPDAPSVCSTL